MSDFRLPRWAPWPIGVGLVVVAWFVALVTPGEDQAQAPFHVTAAVGEPATGRNLNVTVTDIRRAGEVSAGGWSAEGNWLVVNLAAASVLSESGAQLAHVELVVDGVRYRASERPASLLQQQLAAGIAQSGSVAFELPVGITNGNAVLELALEGVDTRLDSMILVPFDLAEVTDAGATELAATEWAQP
ncbi:hypothetical protein [Microbacterium yannicii]|uniref:hypothetical protein n=1 Tax=Microbacterium yannicii TaxID=671622 RepID=UPI0003153A61|nr:hypothetical protein [Microbacterium yannicii]